MKYRIASSLLTVALLGQVAYAASSDAPAMGKPAKVTWDVSRLTESDLAAGSATVRFQTDQDVPSVTIRPTPSLTKAVDVQPSGYSDVVAGTWYDVTVDVIGGGPLEETVGGTIQIRGDRGTLAKPLNVSIKVESDDGDSDGGDSDDSDTDGDKDTDTDGDDEDKDESEDGEPTIDWTPDILDAETFAAGEQVTIEFTTARDLGKVCVWLTPSVQDDFTVNPTMFDAVPATDDAGAAILYTIDVQLNQPVANLTSNVGGTLHLRDCSSGKLKRTYDEPLPIDIVVDEEDADEEAAPGAVVSSGDFTEGPVAPNQIVSIFGEGLGPDELETFTVDNGVVGSNLGETTVLFDGVPAPLLAAQSGQVNAIVPGAAAGKKTVQMRVIHRGKVSVPFLLAVNPAAPSIFTLDEFGQGAVLNPDGTVNANGNPVRRGRTVSIFATGGGVADDSLEDGQVLAEPVPLDADVQVAINGIPAKVLWSGAPAGAVNGVLQINIEVPFGGLQPGYWRMAVSIDGFESGNTARIAVW